MAQPSTPSRSQALVLVSPYRHEAPASSTRKRKVTPLSEASSPKKVGLVVPSALIREGQQVLPRSEIPNPLSLSAMNQQSQIDITHHRLLPNPLQGARTVDLPRHITLPYDLRDGTHHPLDKESRDTIYGLFPAVTEIFTNGDFVYLNLDPLPPKPWPKTIGGLPVLFSVAPTSEMVSGGGKGKMVSVRNGRLCDDRNFRDLDDWTFLFETLRDHFLEIEISITEIMYRRSFVTVVLEHRDTDMLKVPATIGQIRCTYVYEDEMGRPTVPQARRQRDPTPGNPDDSQYDDLRPGIRVSSNYLQDDPQAFITSTGGILLQDQLGNKYMTVAGHGFPAKCGLRVMHPSPGNGRDIGELIMGLGHTDIALVKLNSSETFNNTTFHNTLLEESIHLRRLAGKAAIKQNDLVYLDSPDTGCLDGAFQMTSRRRFPSDDPYEQHWVFTTWLYMGQDTADSLPEGMCGSAIWKENGDIIGFFQYAPKSGVMRNWCAGTGADELLERGYILAEESDH